MREAGRLWERGGDVWKDGMVKGGGRGGLFQAVYIWDGDLKKGARHKSIAVYFFIRRNARGTSK